MEAVRPGDEEIPGAVVTGRVGRVLARRVEKISVMVLQLLILSKTIPGRGPAETGGPREEGWLGI